MTRTLSVGQLLEIDFSTLPPVQEFPAIQHFPAEWLTGEATRAMTPEQRGAFIDLLSHAWGQKPPCSLPDDDSKLAGWSGLGPTRWRKIGAFIREQFVRCDDGRLRNPKQVAVWIALRDLRDKRRGANRARRNGQDVATTGATCNDKTEHLSSPALAEAEAEATAAATAAAPLPPVTPRASADPDWEGVKRIVETFPPAIRPNPQLVVLWVEKLGGSVDEVLAVVWKYPNKGPDYIRKAIDSRALELQEAGDGSNSGRASKHNVRRDTSGGAAAGRPKNFA